MTRVTHRPSPTSPWDAVPQAPVHLDWMATADRSLTLASNRAPADWYPLLRNPVVAESLLDRLMHLRTSRS